MLQHTGNTITGKPPDKAPQRARILIVGEAMLELSGANAPGMPARLAQGGDTFNTALYLARLGQSVAFATALGSDPYSDAMLERWEAEGLDTRLVLRHPDRLPGLYAIRTAPDGERSFHYWRDNSAARALFDLPGADGVAAAAETADWLYFSGITLSILPEHGRARLFGMARTVRQRGGRVAFDPNFRPAGWTDPAQARSLFLDLAPDIDLVLPSREDEDRLFGPADADTHIARWLKAGAGRVILKDGAAGCRIAEAGAPVRHIAAEPTDRVVDTTGAGDGFNAGLLAALVQHAGLPAAAARGHALAHAVVAHPGAIIPAGAMPGPYATA